jgi:hypothetical protein
MTITEKTAPPPIPPSQDGRHIIGIHLLWPGVESLTGIAREHVLLSHILTGALRRPGLLREGQGCIDAALLSKGRITLMAFEREVLGFAPVTDASHARSIIVDELAAVELLSFAHLAWLDFQKKIWVTSHPVPEAMLFESHVNAYRAWQTESPEVKRARLIKCAQKAVQLLEDLGNEESPLAP